MRVGAIFDEAGNQANKDYKIVLDLEKGLRILYTSLFIKAFSYSCNVCPTKKEVESDSDRTTCCQFGMELTAAALIEGARTIGL